MALVFWKSSGNYDRHRNIAGSLEKGPRGFTDDVC
jgi:hypothetical protein